MSSFLIQSLNKLNIHKNFTDPKTGQVMDWALVIQAYDPATQSVSIVTQSLFNKRVDLQITPNANGHYVLTTDDSEPSINFAQELSLKTSDPDYDFGNNENGQCMLVIIGGSDMIAYLQGVWYEFPIEQTMIGIKISGNPGDSTFQHEISYGKIA